MALDLAFAVDTARAEEKLDVWTLPLLSGDRAHSAIPLIVKNKCLEILDAYRQALAGIDDAPTHYELLRKRKNVVLFGPCLLYTSSAWR